MKKRLILGGLTILVLVGAYLAFTQYFKKHSSVLDQNPDVVITAADLFQAYSENEISANERFLNRNLQVTGTVSKTENQNGNLQLFLESEDALFGVQCEMVPGTSSAELTPGTEVTLRGICSGYLMDVNLNRCELIE